MTPHRPDPVHRPTLGLSVIAAACLLAACGGDTVLARNDAPAYLGSVKQTAYDGSTDDLLTAGLLKTGIQQATLALAVSTAVPGAVPFADPLLPTAVELRRAAIYNRYRSIDAFIGFPAVLPGYDTRYVPLHVYLNRALDAVYANLKSGTPLPASQVLRTVPRGGVAGAAPAITAANVPAFVATPAAADASGFSGTTVTIPD